MDIPLALYFPLVPVGRGAESLKDAIFSQAPRPNLGRRAT